VGLIPYKGDLQISQDGMVIKILLYFKVRFLPGYLTTLFILSGIPYSLVHLEYLYLCFKTQINSRFLVLVVLYPEIESIILSLPAGGFCCFTYSRQCDLWICLIFLCSFFIFHVFPEDKLVSSFMFVFAVPSTEPST
jgi:hypothetical protein